jgi:2-oxoisovalerate dehydrogenase E1 component alpha subunit
VNSISASSALFSLPFSSADRPRRSGREGDHHRGGYDELRERGWMAEELQQILTPEGELVGSPPIGLDETRRLYCAMVGARLYDRKGAALQKQGRLATYPPFEGQEAAQIGSASALRAGDWMVPTYRDAAAMWFHGYPWELLILHRMGDERGASPPEDVPVLPPSITVGAHMLHAAGLAWAERRHGRDRIAITYFGDGATSEGDFHEAMNFAGVFALPVVFLCQNNHYAISLRRDRQTASATIAAKAEAYGIPSAFVDGNDLFAMRRAADEAAGRARAGGGPTLIEALTYRLGPHTTADDPRRYRPAEEEALWRTRDPLERVRRHLQRQDAWDGGWQQQIEQEFGAALESAVAGAESRPAMAPNEMFEAMFAEMTPQLRAQQRAFLHDEGGAP